MQDADLVSRRMNETMQIGDDIKLQIEELTNDIELQIKKSPDKILRSKEI